jgi:flagellar basal body P-ring formation protein FlgA
MMSLNKLFRMKWYLLCGLFFALSGIAFADEYENLQDLQTLAKNFAMTQVTAQDNESVNVKVNPLDSDLKLPHCSNKIEASLPQNTNRQQITAVELACNGNNTWRTFVPVNVQILTNVLVTNKAIQPNEIISDSDLEFTAYDKNQLFGGYYQDKSVVIGQEASQLIPAGAVVTKKNLRSPVLVHKNQLIDLIAVSGSIHVTIKAIAKSDGRLNDIIKAVNPSSEKTVQAVVVGDDKAQVVV